MPLKSLKLAHPRTDSVGWTDFAPPPACCNTQGGHYPHECEGCKPSVRWAVGGMKRWSDSGRACCLCRAATAPERVRYVNGTNYRAERNLQRGGRNQGGKSRGWEQNKGDNLEAAGRRCICVFILFFPPALPGQMWEEESAGTAAMLEFMSVIFAPPWPIKHWQ